MLILKNVDAPEGAKWFEITFHGGGTEKVTVAGRLGEGEPKKEDGQDLEDIQKDTLIEQLKDSNRELAHRLADLMTWRDHYKKLYERLLSEILDRVNVG